MRYTITIWEQTCGCRFNILRFHVLNNISRVLDWCSLNNKTCKCQALIGLWFCTRTYMSWTTDGVFTWGPQWQRILVVPFIFFNVLTPYYQNDNEWGYLHEYMVLNKPRCHFKRDISRPHHIMCCISCKIYRDVDFYSRPIGQRVLSSPASVRVYLCGPS